MKKIIGSRPRGATLADVGLAANVSPMTVSKVLRKTGRISEETQERVLEAAVKLGYVPNQLAGSLGSATSNIVCILIPSASDSVYSEILSSISRTLRPLELRTFVGESNFDPEIEYEQVRSFLSIRPAGLILSGGVQRLAKTDDILEKHGADTVQIWDGDRQTATANIGPSHEMAGRMMAEHFVELGLKNVAYIGSELSKDLCAARRAEAFEHTARQHGLKFTAITSESAPRQAIGGTLLTERMLEDQSDIEGVHYLNDAMAIGGIRAMYQRGLVAADHMQVTGFNGTSLATSVRTRLTTIDMSYTHIGEAAANAVISLAAGQPVSAVQVEDCKFVQGNTSGKRN
ncbi:LacI family DNA-binding transcriptional regulator [Roseibium algae]|uniref:LacI family DNA-binding transcriptional regulator n=1 Tax=Roseibium algae TaxID=3123038 RepID=A0ABU8TEI1_9HYPH